MDSHRTTRQAASAGTLGLPGALTLALMLGVVTLIPATAVFGAPAAVGVSMCLALECQARLARRSAEAERHSEVRTVESPSGHRAEHGASAPLNINGVGAPRWRPLSEVRAALMNIPPPTAIA